MKIELKKLGMYIKSQQNIKIFYENENVVDYLG